MADFVTPNLPSRDFETTAAFYKRLGFDEAYRDAGWMILRRGPVQLEFFPFPDLDPATSGYGACLRLDEADSFYEVCRNADVPQQSTGRPRLHPLRREPWGGRVGALIDPDGSLLRIIAN